LIAYFIYYPSSMNLDQRQQIKKYLDILLRRKRILIACMLFGTAIGIGHYLTKPKIYKSTALIKYERQSVNPSAMSPDDIRTNTRDVVETISQQIMSRSSLEGIIKELGLYADLQKSIPMEDIVDMMRQHHIESQLMQRGDVIEVSYKGSDQNKVVRVTNMLAAKFIEENMRVRQDRASQTSTYIRDELNMAKESLDKKELIMRDYKLKYYNEMPDQLTNNMNRLIALQDQYQNNQTSIHELERTKLMVQEQLSMRQELPAPSSSQLSAGTSDSTAMTGGLNDLYQARAKLKSLQTRYTEKHPEIKRLKKIISDLEQQYGVSEGENEKQASGQVQDSAGQQFQPQLQGLRNQIKEIENNLVRLKEEREELAAQIQTYNQWIASTPIREAEWAALTRDYEQLNLHYEKLVTESLQAESAQSLENQLKGSQFKIIDSAHFPEKPFEPDFRKIIALAIGLGLTLGGAIALSLELVSTSFKDPNELERFMGIPVVCAVPVIRTKNEIVKEKILHIALDLTLLLAATAILGAAVYLWKQGMIVI
jgi:succinoglycan biosynthesis transport protein ExoP